MADVITLARSGASILFTADTIPQHDPEAIRLHGLAHNALATALHLLNRVDTTPAQLQQATARAVRAATLLKRASRITAQGGAA